VALEMLCILLKGMIRMKKAASVLILSAMMLSLCESAYAAKIPTVSKSSADFTGRTEPSVMPYYTNQPVHPVVMPYRTDQPVDPVIVPDQKDHASHADSASR